MSQMTLNVSCRTIKLHVILSVPTACLPTYGNIFNILYLLQDHGLEKVLNGFGDVTLSVPDCGMARLKVRSHTPQVHNVQRIL